MPRERTSREPSPAGAHAPARDDQGGPSPRGLLLGTLGAVLVLAAFQIWWGMDIRGQAERLEQAVTRMEQADAANAERLEIKIQGVRERLDGLQQISDEWELVLQDLERLRSDVAKIIVALEQGAGAGGPRGDIDSGFEPPPALDWTEPALYDAAKRSAEAVGISLTEDEVRVPSKIVLHEGLLEYFAVLKGGKEHEALISLQGNTPAEERRPKDFGARFNNALQALGFKPGRPLRFSRNGTLPPQGETVYLFVEWTEGDERVVVRGSDLVWNRIEGRPMESRKWVYVGSSFVPDDDGSPLFAADLTAEAIATYSAINAIIDNTTAGAADDTVFIAATPRLPKDVVLVDLVFRRTDKEPTRTFPPQTGGPAAPQEGDER